MAGLLFFGLAVTANGALDMFLKIDGIPGESTHDTHADEIEVLAWSFGITGASTGAGGTGRAGFGDLQVTKYVDKATPKLYLACASGEPIRDCRLYVHRPEADKPGVDYIIFHLEKVTITSASTNASGSDDRPTETVTLNYGKITWTYTPLMPSGKYAPPIATGWDLETNTPTE